MHEVGRPKAIIFDCWNTIMYVRSRPTLLDRVSLVLLNHPLNYRTLKRMENSLMRHPQHDSRAAARKLIRDFYLPPVPYLINRTQNIIEGRHAHYQPFQESIATLKQLKKTYKLGLLSNTHELIFDRVRREYKFDSLFDAVVPSYETGLLKPEPEIFQLILGKLGVEPHEAVMVGDSLRDDVLGAEAMGMRGILVDRHNRRPKRQDRVRSLDDLPDLLTS
jgi:2-haloalkanoic acid dehalogenase type II